MAHKRHLHNLMIFVCLVVTNNAQITAERCLLGNQAPSCTCEPVINVSPSAPSTPPSPIDITNLTKWLTNLEAALNTSRQEITQLNSELATLKAAPQVNHPNSHNESDYSNYYDEIAEAACTAMNTAGGFTYAVRRECPTSRTCSVICSNQSLRAQDGQVASRSMRCLNALHVYNNRPQFAHRHASGIEKLSLKTYRYNNCASSSCGPNYCCCRA